MNDDIELFLEECRTFLTPEQCDAAETVLRGWYEHANDSPEWQETWDRFCEAIRLLDRRDKRAKLNQLLQEMLSDMN